MLEVQNASFRAKIEVSFGLVASGSSRENSLEATCIPWLMAPSFILKANIIESLQLCFVKSPSLFFHLLRT